MLLQIGLVYLATGLIVFILPPGEKSVLSVFKNEDLSTCSKWERLFLKTFFVVLTISSLFIWPLVIILRFINRKKTILKLINRKKTADVGLQRTEHLTAQNDFKYQVVKYPQDSDAEQFSFTTKIYSTTELAIKELGADAALDILNAEVSVRIGLHALKTAGFNKIEEASEADRAKIRSEFRNRLLSEFPDAIIFSENDARNWKPEKNELSLSGTWKKINETYKFGKMDEFKFWINQLQNASQREQERRAARIIDMIRPNH